MKTPVNVRILFFGATADIVGAREFEATSTTSSELIADVVAKFPRLGQHKLLISINQAYLKRDTPLSHGDEIAIFTAVSGG